MKVLIGLVTLLAYLFPTFEKCFANSSDMTFQSYMSMLPTLR